MDFNSIPLFGVMRAKLIYDSSRQATLAQNIANADTPGYQAKDIKDPNFKEMAHKFGSPSSQRTQNYFLSMTVTHPGHVNGNRNSQEDFKTIDRPTTNERTLNNNNVVIEEEMAKVADNQADYQQVLGIYRKTADMFKTAIGRPTGS